VKLTVSDQSPELARTDADIAKQARLASAPPPPRESWLLRTGLSLTVWTLAGVATVLAATGQVEFARWAGITDARAYAVPAVLELVAVAFLLMGYRRARRGDSAAALWLLAAGVGGFAVYTNVVHSGGRSGLVFGAASAITMVLWFVKLRDDYRHFQRHTGQATRPRPKLGALWMVAPRLSTRAWMVATRRRISTVDEAVGYAEVWRAVYEDARKARVGRALARRTAWRSVAQVAGGVWADLPQTAEIAAVQVLRRDAPKPEPITAVAAQVPADAYAAARAGGMHPHGNAEGSTVGPAPVLAGFSDGGLLRERIWQYLDSNVDLDDADTIDDDDPYLLWMTARDLGVSVESVTEHVRDWCRLGRQSQGADHRSGRWPPEAWQAATQPPVRHNGWPVPPAVNA
jgi:Protein of unknown function (DUF2637)